MPLAPWRSPLARAIHRNRAKAHSRYFQLATVDHHGRPANRTVVFRGFTDTALKMITDGRSEKIQQIHQHPWGEICWYFTSTREQFRIAGSLSLIESDTDSQNLRQQVWQQLSNRAQQQFYWPHPGQPRNDDADSFADVTVEDSPPDTFRVVLLEPDRVDHLELRGEPQNRYLYQKSTQGWQTTSVNP